jgi:hypothetical protein
VHASVLCLPLPNGQPLTACAIYTKHGCCTLPCSQEA